MRKPWLTAVLLLGQVVISIMIVVLINNYTRIPAVATVFLVPFAVASLFLGIGRSDD